MNEKFLELRKYLLSSTNEERNGKVSEMTEEQINDFYKIYHHYRHFSTDFEIS